MMALKECSSPDERFVYRWNFYFSLKEITMYEFVIENIWKHDSLQLEKRCHIFDMIRLTGLGINQKDDDFEFWLISKSDPFVN